MKYSSRVGQFRMVRCFKPAALQNVRLYIARPQLRGDAASWEPCWQASKFVFKQDQNWKPPDRKTICAQCGWTGMWAGRNLPSAGWGRRGPELRGTADVRPISSPAFGTGLLPGCIFPIFTLRTLAKVSPTEGKWHVTAVQLGISPQ